MRAEIVTVGDEILAGSTQDTNSAWLARRLQDLGIPLQRVTQVGDRAADIQDAVRGALERAPVVVVTGGLGPTADDHTKEDLADLFGDPLVFDAAVYESIAARFRQHRLEMPEINRKQAMLPRGARPLPNPVGSAPGIHWERGGADVFLLPGVPAEMRAIWDGSIAGILRRRFPDVARRRVVCLRTTGLPESEVAQRLETDRQHFAALAWAFYPSLRGVDVVLRGDAACSEWEAAVEAVRRALGPAVYAEQPDVALEAVIAERLTRDGRTLVVAESCTGGLLGKRLTDVPGSSAWFLGGFTTYANRAKQDWLGVPAGLLERLGAVSEPVAAAMADGARRRAGADLALSVTGIAGPAGERPGKPVGLVFVGLADAEVVAVRRFQLGRVRAVNRERAAQAALDILRRHLTGLPWGGEAVPPTAWRDS